MSNMLSSYTEKNITTTNKVRVYTVADMAVCDEYTLLRNSTAEWGVYQIQYSVKRVFSLSALYSPLGFL